MSDGHVLLIPYANGGAARTRGVARDQNPYLSRTIEARSWEAGWDDEPDMALGRDEEALEEVA